MDLLLRIFGIKATGAGRVAGTDLAFHGVNPAYILVTAIILGVAVFWMYRRELELSATRRIILTCLRAIFLLLILGLLLRPVLTVTFEHLVRRTLLMVIDSSSSMNDIKDQRRDEDDRKRVAIARGGLDPAGGLKQPLPSDTAGLAQVSRVEIIQSALKNERMDLLRRLAKDYDLSVYTFDKSLAGISAAEFRANLEEQEQTSTASLATLPKLNTAWVDRLEAQGKSTAIGDALRQVISEKRGQPLAGVFLMTDGANNRGLQPFSAARLAGQDRVPLWVWGVGITSPKDIIVARNLLVQEVAFARDEVPVTVRVRSMGMAGQTAILSVKLGEERAEKEVVFNADGEQLVTVNLTPKVRGEFTIEATIPPRDDEVVRTNNSASQKIRVIDDRIKVLFIDQFPRWEFKYVQAILMRDRRIDLKCLLLEADKSVTAVKDSPYLAEFPQKKEDLFKYDLVILGDVDPKTFSPGQLEMLAEFVSKFGGATVVLAGKRYMPATYRGTVLEKMLPVELDVTDTSAGMTAARPIKPELTPAGRSSLMLRLAERELDSVARWAQLPAFYWVAKVARAKPAAEVLLVDPDPSRATRAGKMPVMAMQQYGMGQVLFIGTDNLWRWRRVGADRYHSILWGQIAQRMALQHLLGASKRTQLTSDQKEYTIGATVTLYARLYNEGFEPMTEALVNSSYWETTNPNALPRQLQLRAMPERPGMYRGELVADPGERRGGGAAPAGPAIYRFAVDHDRSTFLEFIVTDPILETAEPAMNKPLLEQMATASGGRFFREEDLNDLPEKIGAKNERKRSIREVELWSSPFYFLLMLTAVTAEWVVRKMSQLK